MDNSSALPSTPARVVVVDDHEVVRTGLRALIDGSPDLVVVGEAETVEGAIRLVESTNPDVVVMDLRLPDGSGIAACRQIRLEHDDVRVLILTSYADDDAVSAAIEAGASGYVIKRVAAFDLVSVIRDVAAGGTAFDQGSGGPGPGAADADELLARLSPQERLIAELLSQGLTNREIAARMDLADKTVKNYVSHLLTKLGMRRRSEAAAYVARVDVEHGHQGLVV
jgi:two-component system, NarL family, response regulator DevR